MMRRKTLKQSPGFTLIELLIVIAILAILAAVVVPNVAEFYTTGPSISERAEYIVYVEEDGQRKQVGTIDIGEVWIWLPKEMSVGDSEQVLLRLIPSEQVADRLRVAYDPTGKPSNYYEVSDTIDFYPYMSAELKAVNFDVSSSTTYYRVVSLDSSTDWTWNISPKRAGEQLLTIELNEPVRVESLEELAAIAVYRHLFEMSVKEPFDWAIVWRPATAIGVLLAGIAALIAVLHRRRSIDSGGMEETKVGAGHPVSRESRRIIDTKRKQE